MPRLSVPLKKAARSGAATANHSRVGAGHRLLTRASATSRISTTLRAAFGTTPTEYRAYDCNRNHDPSIEREDLPEAERIYRLAFGTSIGLPDPMKFAGDADYVKTRWLADPASALGAESASELIGSNFLTIGQRRVLWPLDYTPGLLGQGRGEPIVGTDDGHLC